MTLLAQGGTSHLSSGAGWHKTLGYWHRVHKTLAYWHRVAQAIRLVAQGGTRHLSAGTW